MTCKNEHLSPDFIIFNFFTKCLRKNLNILIIDRSIIINLNYILTYQIIDIMSLFGNLAWSALRALKVVNEPATNNPIIPTSNEIDEDDFVIIPSDADLQKDSDMNSSSIEINGANCQDTTSTRFNEDPTVSVEDLTVSVEDLTVSFFESEGIIHIGQITATC